MNTTRPKLAASLLAGLLLSATAALPAPASRFTGSLAGYVRDDIGAPQMGATVLLFNRSERLIRRAITNDRGLFGFESLVPDVYSVRVSLSSFMPAMRQKIAVQPGMQSLLYVDLASVLSSIELVYAVPGQGALMSDDWKWTLRGSLATRSVLRLIPELTAPEPNRRDAGPAPLFSDTMGLLNVSAGDSLGASAADADLGTAFALATSVLGRSQLQLSGNIGYSSRTGVPAAGFRTSYRRDGDSREVALTVQQVYLPVRTGLGMLASQGDSDPVLRTISASVRDSIQLDDNLRFDYGTSLDSVTFLEMLNTASEFARLSYDLGRGGKLMVAFSSGAPPVQLVPQGEAEDDPVHRNMVAVAEDLASLSILPRLSLIDGRAALERSQDFEVGYEKKLWQATLSVTGYRETVANAALAIAASDGVFVTGDVLPDVSSNTSVLNAGSFHRTGFAASVSERLGNVVEIGLSGGRGGALSINDPASAVSTADNLRARMRETQSFWASARASTQLPGTHTQISGSYQWMNYGAIMPNHFYLTQSLYPEAGLNVRVRQPLPMFPGLPGRIVATAELRNGLGQGYLPLTANGQQVLLIQTPRSLRGGLSFIF